MLTSDATNRHESFWSDPKERVPLATVSRPCRLTARSPEAVKGRTLHSTEPSLYAIGFRRYVRPDRSIFRGTAGGP